jgi:hypothetical protein
VSNDQINASHIGAVVWCLDPADVAFAWEHTSSVCGASMFGCLNDHVHGCCGAVITATQYWWRIVGACHIAAAALLLVGALGAHVVLHKILLSPVLTALTERHCNEVKIRHTERKEYFCMLVTLATLAAPVVASTLVYTASVVDAGGQLAPNGRAAGNCTVSSQTALRVSDTSSNGT